MKKKTQPEVKSPKPVTHKFTAKQWKEMATCPVCNVLLEREETYRIGWLKRTESGGWLSVRGHPLCVENFYREKEVCNG